VDPLISKEDINSNNFHENNINKEKQNLDALRLLLLQQKESENKKKIL
jgi:hypothetical protein